MHLVLEAIPFVCLVKLPFDTTFPIQVRVSHEVHFVAKRIPENVLAGTVRFSHFAILDPTLPELRRLVPAYGACALHAPRALFETVLVLAEAEEELFAADDYVLVDQCDGGVDAVS